MKNEKKFDKNFEDAIRNAVETGYDSAKLGIPVDQAVEDVLKAVRMGKAIGKRKHVGPQN